MINAPLTNIVCPLCGGANQCAPDEAGSFDVECWCSTVAISTDALARIPPDQVNKACLCPRCAAGLAGIQPQPEDRGESG